MSEALNSNETDQELVVLIRQDNANAFKALYYRYYNQLYRYAYYRVYSVETTKDLIQELFVRIWSRRKTLDPKKSVKAYLYKSLTNLIINHLKLESSKNESYSDINEPHTNVNLDENIDIQTAINMLPEKLKSVFILSRVEGYKYSEIAEILKISVKAVEKRMSKALSLLRKRFP